MQQHKRTEVPNRRDRKAGESHKSASHPAVPGELAEAVVSMLLPVQVSLGVVPFPLNRKQKAAEYAAAALHPATSAGKAMAVSARQAAAEEAARANAEKAAPAIRQADARQAAALWLWHLWLQHLEFWPDAMQCLQLAALPGSGHLGLQAAHLGRDGPGLLLHPLITSLASTFQASSLLHVGQGGA